MNDAPRVLKPHPQCLLTELDDGTGVILNLETKFYFTLNDTAVVLWKALGTGVLKHEDLATELCEAFDVAQDKAEADVQALLSELVDQGLLVDAT